MSDTVEVTLSFELSGTVNQRVKLPASVADKYHEMVEGGTTDWRAFDDLLEGFIRWDADLLNDMEAEEIEIVRVYEQ